MGIGSGILFVVVPPEGALDTTVIVRQVREANGAKITLETMRFTAEESTIVALAAPVADGSTVPRRTLAAPAATATAIPLQGAHTPTPAPVPVDGDLTNLEARYQVDGGPWHRLGSHGYRVTPEGCSS